MPFERTPEIEITNENLSLEKYCKRKGRERKRDRESIAFSLISRFFHLRELISQTWTLSLRRRWRKKTKTEQRSRRPIAALLSAALFMRQVKVTHAHSCSNSRARRSSLSTSLTLVWLIHSEPCCWRSMSSLSFRYQASGAFRVITALNTCPQILSSFWHCSRSFLLLLWADLQSRIDKIEPSSRAIKAMVARPRDVLTLVCRHASPWWPASSRLWGR